MSSKVFQIIKSSSLQHCWQSSKIFKILITPSCELVAHKTLPTHCTSTVLPVTPTFPMTHFSSIFSCPSWNSGKRPWHSCLICIGLAWLMLCHARHATLHHTTLYHTMYCYAIPHHNTPHHVMPCLIKPGHGCIWNHWMKAWIWTSHLFFSQICWRTFHWMMTVLTYMEVSILPWH